MIDESSVASAVISRMGGFRPEDINGKVKTESLAG